MKKYVKNQILDVFVSIGEAVEYVKNHIEHAEMVLTDCLESMSIIRGVIEPELSSAHFKHFNQIFEKIEENINILDKEFSSINTEIFDDTINSIDFIRNELENEIVIKFEIVFMPYNASMWDSLESIWAAANEDSRCETYVIPLPYYTKNNEGMFEQLKYEGEDFPSYVPITHYTKYDMSLRQPDIIYIHNPYDQYNNVTSVDPKYYSYNLKKYTDMLVYIPYFISRDIVYDSFCVSSATKHVNKIILQSEYIKKFYAKYIHDNEKLVALGSPKLDKVLLTRPEEFCLPEEWVNVIKNKKIIFYNTHLSNFISGEENFINKLNYVLSVFEKREDVVLWWRPHPLSEGTIQAMNPKILETYYAIVEEYKQKNFGIYDDTKDLHRAIALSDAYYGATSSVAVLYNATGKPALFHNIGIKEFYLKKNEIKLSIWDFAIKNGKMWFVPQNMNALFSMDLDTYHLKYIGCLPDERMFDFGCFTVVEIKDNYLVLTPGRGNNIIAYNMTENKFETKFIECADRYKFLSSYRHGDDIYMIPYKYPALVKYNIRNEQITEDRKICEILDKHRLNTSDYYFHKGGLIHNDSIMLVSNISNNIIKYDIISAQYTVYSVGDLNNRYVSIAYDGNNYWLFQRKGCIIKWNEMAGTTEELKQYPDNFQQGETYDFLIPLVYGKYVFVFPYESNMVLRINIETNEIESFVDLGKRDTLNSQFWWGKYLCAQIVEDNIYAFSACENVLQKMNPETGEIENIEFILSDEELDIISKKSLFNAPENIEMHPFYEAENMLVTLEFFLGRVSSEKIMEEQISMKEVERLFANVTGDAGKHIHEYIIKEIQ